MRRLYVALIVPLILLSFAIPLFDERTTNLYQPQLAYNYRTISIDGNFSDWQGVSAYVDPIDDNWKYNDGHDWDRDLANFSICHDANYVYFRIALREGAYFWGGEDVGDFENYYILIDWDEDNSTGATLTPDGGNVPLDIGWDYGIYLYDPWTVRVYQTDGTNYANIADLTGDDYAYYGNQIELRVPVSILGGWSSLATGRIRVVVVAAKDFETAPYDADHAPDQKGFTLPMDPDPAYWDPLLSEILVAHDADHDAGPDQYDLTFVCATYNATHLFLRLDTRSGSYTYDWSSLNFFIYTFSPTAGILPRSSTYGGNTTNPGWTYAIGAYDLSQPQDDPGTAWEDVGEVKNSSDQVVYNLSQAYPYQNHKSDDTRHISVMCVPLEHVGLSSFTTTTARQLLMILFSTQTDGGPDHDYVPDSYGNTGDWLLLNMPNPFNNFVIYDFSDDTGPAITAVSHEPSPPTYRDIVIVYANASDPSTVAHVWLKYSIDGINWILKEMQRVSGDEYSGRYSTSVGPFPWNTTVTYYIIAEDNAVYPGPNNSTDGPYSFTVVDNDAPYAVWVNQSPPRDDVTYGDDVNVTIKLSDIYDGYEGSGINASTVYLHYSINGVAQTPIQMNQLRDDIYYAIIPATGNIGDNVSYYATFEDNAGNLGQSGTYNYTTLPSHRPKIHSVEQQPATPAYNQSVTIRANVTDDNGLRDVFLYYRVNGGAYTKVRMDLSGGFYQAVIPSQPYAAKVDYYVNATDVDDQSRVSDVQSYTVSDPYPPAISAPRRVPDIVEYDVSPTIYVNVSEPPEASGVKEVILHIVVEGKEQTITMSRAFGNTYNASIPAQPYGAKVSYFVEARDNAGNVAKSNTYSYEVADLKKPSVCCLEIRVKDSTLMVNATAEDEGSGIAGVWLYYSTDNETWKKVKMSYVEGKWVGVAELPAGATVYYYVEAVDGAGNVARTEIRTIKTPSKPPAVAPIWTYVLIGVVVAVGAILAFLYLRKRRKRKAPSATA